MKREWCAVEYNSLIYRKNERRERDKDVGVEETEKMKDRRIEIVSNTNRSR